MKNLMVSKVSMSIAVLAMLAVFGLAGCGGGGGDNSGSGSSSTHINTTAGTTSLATSVSTLDSSTATQVATTDNTSVTFNGTPAATQTLKPGDIFIVQDTARKVESIAVVNGQTVIKTIEPELHEVIKTIDVSGDVFLGEEHILKASVPSKVQLSVKKAKSMSAIDIGGIGTGNTFTYTFANYVIDGDGNQSTTYDQVSLNGDIVLDAPKIIFLLKYGIISDKYAEISFKAGEKLNLALSSKELTFDKKLSIPLGSLIIPIAVTGGTVNVTVSLNLVFEANGKAKFSASFSQNIVIDAGMTAALGPAKITSFNNSSYGWDFKQPQIEGEINTSAAVNPDVDLKFLQYRLAGINNSLAVKAKAKANIALTNACYRVSADANVSSIAFIMLPKAAFNLDFSWSGVSGGLDLSMAKYPKELFTYTKGLYDSGDICAVSNAAPIANAGEDKTSNVKAAVFLDGTGSYDSDGSVVSYSWTQVSGSSVALSDANTATPYFIASSSAGALSFRLTVTDNKGATATDDVTVNVLPGETNSRPIADAGADQAVNGGTTALLNGSLSLDIDGFIAAYQWVQTGGTQVSLTNAITATPSFTAPSTGSTLTFKLTVTDNKGATATDYVQVFVTASGGGGSTNTTNIVGKWVGTNNLGDAGWGIFSADNTFYTNDRGAGAGTLSGSYSVNGDKVTASGTSTVGTTFTFSATVTNTTMTGTCIETYSGVPYTWTFTLDKQSAAVSGWSSGSSMPTAREWAASAVAGNDIYVIGGATNSGTYNNVEKYNTLTNSWTTLPAMPFQDFLLRGATVSGKVYIFGGYMSSNQLVYRYDPASGIWTKLNNMPYLQYMGAPAVVNNKVYIFGGEDSTGTVTNKVLEYDPSNDTWTTKASMPTARYAPATAVYNNMIYVLGGNYGGNKNELYDPATNTWQTKAAVPFSNGGWGVAGEINGKIYFVDSDTSKMAVYFPSNDSWTSVSGLSTPRDYMTGETVNGNLYVIGGQDSSSSVKSNIVDIYTPSASLAPVFKSPAFQNMEVQTDYSAYYDLKHRTDEEALKLMLPVR